ncbi:MAG: hypothetical protein RR623_10495 [Bacilli bacterium]
MKNKYFVFRSKKAMGSNFPFGAGCFYSALLLIGSNYFELNPYVILLIIWLPILFFYIMYFFGVESE